MQSADEPAPIAEPAPTSGVEGNSILTEEDSTPAPHHEEWHSNPKNAQDLSTDVFIDDDLVNGSHTTRQDPFAVGWEEPVDQDPANPLNWTSWQTNVNIGVISFLSFLTFADADCGPLASSMFAPSVPQVMQDFKSDSNLLAAFVVSVYILGFAFGPLVVAPISELKGRLIVYHTCNTLFFVFTIISALSQTMVMLIVFRFLAGFVGVAPTTIGSGTIADLIPRERRALYMSLWSMGPILGPVVGPIAGGFLAEAKGWRWEFWVLAMVGGTATTGAFLILRETFAPVVLEKKADQLRKSTGNPLYHSILASNIPPKDLFLRSIVRPSKMLIMAPIVSLMSIYVAVLYGLLYILFTTFTFVFEGQYNFSTGTSGLSFIGSGVGTVCGVVVYATLGDRLVRVRNAGGETPVPEDRLPIYLVLPASLSIPAGLIIYGWAADKRVHWVVPQIGNAVTSVGMMIIVMSVQTYLVDAFTEHAASAIAANTVLRSVLGALLPLCGLQLYDAIGLGWGNTLLGFIALGMAPIPVLLGMFGARLRNSKMGRVTF
ncbi:cycloheximide resistance protein [Rhizodiscina lignyota]|uniref:Cycloheximide resistance protein n=1 Tax=Rhizodiscina lignyota TaxID=1504668 RepID=A0A9P4I842_9PEZI|nr:cycloheximide resistance protein [Rhizodiscina lignyota]